ncbi:aminoglycoside 6'-N-acetyltransferase [Tumebacillus sp. BK434]|uniref:GNAT family N-acetyltransferase n=1 Tax=Tumebacillus sp. BK434 TaxID=2512169 RepID=UPI0010CFE5C4|nr:GNAT family N-acetyltransferase [Tumebacillus sp. BK434]TCP59264.1 aminoglycoside 6'-N-acetyltransferase [Tumebacillus sp. BK434]
MISFRPLLESDLPLLQSWLNLPHVKAAFSGPQGMTMEEVRQKYMPRIAGHEPTRPFLFLQGGVPVGYIQTYLWRDHPAYSSALQLTAESASLDLFIGEESAQGHGLGPQVLQAFLTEVIFADPAVQSCVITPLASNARACRAYEKAGFVHKRTLVHPDEPEPVQLMELLRPDAKLRA